MITKDLHIYYAKIKIQMKNISYMNKSFFDDVKFSDTAINRYKKILESMSNEKPSLDKLFYMDSQIILPDIFF